MDKTLSFFRLFDIAFFIPGAIVFGSLWYRGWFKWLDDPTMDATIRPVFLSAVSIVGVYALGLFAHGVQRGLTRVIGAWRWLSWINRLLNFLVELPTNDTWFKTTSATQEDKPVGSSSFVPWYSKLDKDRRDELALYFWYMRATCRNTAVALLGIIPILWVRQGPITSDRALWLSTMAVVLFIVGTEYANSVTTAVVESEPDKPKPNGDKDETGISVKAAVTLTLESPEGQTAALENTTVQRRRVVNGVPRLYKSKSLNWYDVARRLKR